MHLQTSITLLAALVACLTVTAMPQTAPISAAPAPGKYIGYWPSYNYKVQSINQLNFKLYTDLYFFVAVPQKDMTITYGDLDVTTAENMAREFVKQCNQNGVKPIIVYGGYTGSRFFSELTSTDDKRDKFAAKLVEHAKGFGFSGLEASWLYPNLGAGMTCNTKDPRDTVNFGKLMKKIRELWPEAQLSASVSIVGLIGANGPATTDETTNLVASLNYVNMMSYDFYGPWSTTTGPASAISSRCSPMEGDVSIETGLPILMKQGFKPEQITIAIPAYARSFELANTTLVERKIDGKSNYYYQSKTSKAIRGGATDDEPGTDVCGQKTGYGGTWLVRELIGKFLANDDLIDGINGYRRYYDDCSKLPYLTNNKIFFTYDDQFSAVAKAQLAKSSNLAGLNIFDTAGFPDKVNQKARAALQ